MGERRRKELVEETLPYALIGGWNMDRTLIVAIIGSLTSLTVAGIGFVAAVKAARVASDRETKRIFAIKRHEAIVEAIRILQNRATIFREIVLVAESKPGDAEIVDLARSILSLLSNQDLVANREMFGVVPYVPHCPAFSYDEQCDLSKVLSFFFTCKAVDASLKLRGTNMPTTEEVAMLKKKFEEIREPVKHEYEKAVKLVDYLCDQLKGDVHEASANGYKLSECQNVNRMR